MPIFNENIYLDDELMIAWFGFNREIFVMKSQGIQAKNDCCKL